MPKNMSPDGHLTSVFCVHMYDSPPAILQLGPREAMVCLRYPHTCWSCRPPDIFSFSQVAVSHSSYVSPLEFSEFFQDQRRIQTSEEFVLAPYQGS